MKKLNITKERFEKSRYFQKKYGKLEYVSESGRLFKTSKGKVLKFNESDDEIGDAVKDAYDKYRACSTEPKVCHAIKINDDGTEKKIGIWMDRGNSIGGIVKAIQDGRLRKVLRFSESGKSKFVKESVGTGNGSSVGITCKIALRGDSPEEVLQDLHHRLLSLDAAITDGNEEPNPKIVEKYNHWEEENGGDVVFTIEDPGYHLDGVHCEIYAVNHADGL